MFTPKFRYLQFYMSKASNSFIDLSIIVIFILYTLLKQSKMRGKKGSISSNLVCYANQALESITLAVCALFIFVISHCVSLIWFTHILLSLRYLSLFCTFHLLYAGGYCAVSIFMWFWINCDFSLIILLYMSVSILTLIDR